MAERIFKGGEFLVTEVTCDEIFTPEEFTDEQKQIAEQQLLRAQTEVLIAEQEALRYDTLNKSLDDRVLYKLFLDKWDGMTQVVPGLPGTNGGMPSVIVGSRK